MLKAFRHYPNIMPVIYSMTSLSPIFQIAAAAVSVEDTLLWTHLISFIGFVLAIVVLGRLIMEQRNPSNIYAWGLLIVFVPFLGAPLYLIFGGRKVRRLVESKREIQEIATEMAREHTRTDSAPFLQERSSGNHVELLKDGVDAHHALCDAIDNAKESIYILTYILGNDATGREIIERLSKRAREGVKVRLLMDALGSLGRGGRFVSPLREAGGEVERFMPVVPIHRRASANLRNHRKIAIIDNQTAYIGGQNLDSRFMSREPHAGLFLDFSIRVRGPAISALSRLFISDWCYAAGVNPRNFAGSLTPAPQSVGDVTLKIIASGPDVDNDPLWERILLMIQDCRGELILVTPYFIPDDVIYQSLLVKARAGYRVRLVMPLHSNQPLLDFARGHYVRNLHAAGADIQFYTPGMLHAKLIIADGTTAMTGSANIDMRSLFLNFEVGIYHETKSSVHDLECWVAEHLKACIPYSQTHYMHSSKRRRSAEDIAKLAVPLL